MDTEHITPGYFDEVWANIQRQKDHDRSCPDGSCGDVSDYYGYQEIEPVEETEDNSGDNDE